MVLVVFALVPTVVRTLDVYGQGPATAAAASVGHPPGRQDTVTTCAAFGVPHASVCRKVELHVSIPTKHARGICAACVRRPCIWELLTKYKAYERSSGGGHAGYLFDKAYVVHYSPRAHRKARSIERLRAWRHARGASLAAIRRKLRARPRRTCSRAERRSRG